MRDDDRLILWERPEGIPWLVAHWAARGAVAVTPAPPEWASPELAEAVTGALLASVEGFCDRCEAVRPAGEGSPGPVAVSAAPVPHAAWCPRSGQAVRRLEAGCRPPGARWAADTSPATMAALQEYVGALAARLAGDAESRSLPGAASPVLRERTARAADPGRFRREPPG